MNAANAPFREARVGGCVEATIETRADGVRVLRSTEPLEPYPARLTDRLAHWAEHAGDRVFAAQRDETGDWQRITYRDMLARAQALGQALLNHELSAERPLAILSDNDLEHLSLAMAAMWVGVPYTCISPAYSLLSTDHGKLRYIVGKVTPGMVFAADERFGRAIEAVIDPGVPVVLTRGSLDTRTVLRFDDLLATTPTAAVEAAHAATGPDTVAKLLFTSGSTKQPKGVTTTQRMLCANQQMLRQCFRFVEDEPPVMVDWLPWNHVFGGSHNVGLVLYNGGTLYIDEGKPTAAGIAATLRNLREISPTVYFNVPKGLEEIVKAMDSDTALRSQLFARLQAIMFAGAGLSQEVWDQLDAHAVAATGQRVRVLSGLGMTETAPACVFVVGTHAKSGYIGLPCPGVEVKLVPLQGKTEVRFRGPNVMPGYWRDDDLSREVFDEEGFYRTGDAVRFVDEAQPHLGLLFDGRIAEDFKLSTGTFVSVGPLRARITAEGHPLVQDVVITGINRDDIGALIFPRLADCHAVSGLPPGSPATEVMHHPAVRARFQALADRLWREGTGSATRVARMHVLVEPPSIDRGEVTDKGSINQRAVLQHRAALVEALYEGPASDPYLFLPNQS